MPSRKRHHDTEGEESETSGSDNEISDSGGHETPKRARIEGGLTNGRNMTDEDIATVQHSERLQAERGGDKPENTPAEGGIILSVVCENFMCHSHLTCPLGPQMNFIIGHNGSGKSAILTALTLALGGKAAATNRGNSMKSFIKEGTDTARISVKLKNGGDGFKQDKYGDVIIIERKFAKDGSSGYKLKSRDGKLISTKKDELDDICDFYGLQVDNPMTILTQDAAREFLSGSSNAQKYSFFAKGVQLEQLDADYQLIGTSLKSMEAALVIKGEAVASLERKLKEAKKKVEMFDSHDTLRDQIRLLQNQMAWVQVAEAEQALAKAQEGVDRVLSNIEKAEEKKEEMSQKFEAADRELEAIKERLKVQQEKKRPIEEQNAVLKDDFDTNKATLMTMQVDEREMKNEMSRIRDRIDVLKKKIRNEESRLEQQNGGTSSRLVDDQKEAEARKEQLKEQIASLESEIKELQGQSSDQALREAQARRTRKNEDISKTNNILQNLRRADTGGLGAFGGAIGQVVRAIDNERGWREKPVGPIGRYVTLKAQAWMSIVEKFFGSTLSGFVVSHRQDADLLKRIMSQYHCNAPVFVTTHKQIRMDEPDPKYMTIHRILDVSNELALLQLIVSHGPEQVILIKERNDANEVMANRQRSDNITQCFALSTEGWGWKVGGGFGAMGVTPVRPYDGQSRMKTDRATHMRDVEHTLHTQRQELQDIDAEVQHLSNAEREHKALIADKTDRRRRLRIELDKVEDDIERLKASIEEISQDSELGPLQAEKKLEEDKLSTMERQYTEFIAKRGEHNEQQNRIVARMKDLKQDLGFLDNQCKDIERDMLNVERRRASALEDKNRYYRRRDEFQVILDEQFQPELENAKATVEEFEEGAREVCERVEIPPGTTVPGLDRRLQKLTAEITAAEESLGGTREEIIYEFTQLHSEYEKAKSETEQCDQLISAATRVLRDRRARWKEFQKHISARARAQFMFMMSERAFKGRLRLEHTERPPELIIEVQPGGEDSGNRGPKTLSGGEKSFSTICLLLSLWEAMGSPIRCLDEFDVFMDPVNRSISVDMMIKAAERSIGKQFIMITPQNMSRASTTNAKIFRLSDPDRGTGQTTLVLQ